MAWRMELQSWAAAMYDNMFRVPEFLKRRRPAWSGSPNREAVDNVNRRLREHFDASKTGRGKEVFVRTGAQTYGQLH